jgi:hypothetical protein
VISIAATEAGKMLTFWMPLLFKPKAFRSPLRHLLGKHNVMSLARIGITINIIIIRFNTNSIGFTRQAEMTGWAEACQYFPRESAS